MVMLADILKRKPSPAQQASQGTSTASLGGKSERVYVYDWNELLGYGAAWTAQLPLADLMEHLPVTCRYTPNIRAVRYWGALVGLLLGVAAVSGAFYPLLSYYGAIMGFLLGAGPGAVLGWVLSPRSPVTPRPFWVVRRVWLLPEGGQTEPDAEDPALFAQFNEGWRRYVMPVEFSFLNDGAYMSGDGADISQSHQLIRGTVDTSNGHKGQRQVFLPIVHRATSLFEALRMREYKALQKKILSGWQKVQSASVAVLAGVALGALIFVVIVTSDMQKPEPTPSTEAGIPAITPPLAGE